MIASSSGDVGIHGTRYPWPIAIVFMFIKGLIKISRKNVIQTFLSFDAFMPCDAKLSAFLRDWVSFGVR